MQSCGQDFKLKNKHCFTAILLIIYIALFEGWLIENMINVMYFTLKAERCTGM